MSKISLKLASTAVGKSVSYFSVIKKLHPNTFRQMMFLGKGNILVGYRELQNKKSETQREIERLYFEQNDNSHFVQNLVKCELFDYYESAYSFCHKIVISKELSYPHFMRARKILKVYKKKIVKPLGKVIYAKQLKQTA